MGIVQPVSGLTHECRKNAIFVSLSALLLATTGCGRDEFSHQSTLASDLTEAHKKGCTVGKTVTVATYNVENMWDDDDTNTPSPYADYSSLSSNWISDKMAYQKARHVAHVLEMAGKPDIVGLEEIESALNKSRSLDILKTELKRLGYEYYALGKQNENDPTSVTTAVVSKYPITQNASLDFVYTGRNSTGSARDPQVVDVAIGQLPVRVYVSHWKSKRGNDPAGDNMRKAVSALIKADVDAARAQNPKLDMVVMGDFNAHYTEAPLAVEMNQAATRTELSSKAGKAKMYNLWFELPDNKRCSYVHKGERNCLDHMLVSSSLLDNSGLRLKPRAFKVIGHGRGEEELLNANGHPFRWQVSKKYVNGKAFSEHTGLGFSDHLPLVAGFTIKSCSHD